LKLADAECGSKRHDGVARHRAAFADVAKDAVGAGLEIVGQDDAVSP